MSDSIEEIDLAVKRDGLEKAILSLLRRSATPTFWYKSSNPYLKEITDGVETLITAEIIAELERLLDEINTFQEYAPEPNETLKRVNKAIFKRLAKLKAKETQL